MVIRTFSNVLRADSGSRFKASVFGCEREDGLWEGWLQFEPQDQRHRLLKTNRETTQSSRTDLEYWASGLEPTYLEGAFNRAQSLAPRRVPVRRALGRPAARRMLPR